MILRSLSWIAALAAVGALAHWLGDHPGDLRFDWLGYRVETSIGVGVMALGSVLLLAVVVIYGMARLSHLPLRLRLARQKNAQTKSLDALTEAFVALAIGDRSQALLRSRQAEKRLGAHPLIALVRAQAARSDGDPAAARRELESLLGHETTRMLAASHLSLLARREGRAGEALAHAETAYRLAPGNLQAVLRLLDLTLAEERFDDAVALLAPPNPHGPGIAHARALARTLRARHLRRMGDASAHTEARAAHRAEPGFVPAAAIAIETALDVARTREAVRTVRRTWRTTPHPELARLLRIAMAGRGETAQRRLAAAIVRHREDDPESQALMGEIAFQHGHYDEAARCFAAACRQGAEPRFARRLAEAETKAGYPPSGVVLTEDQAWRCGACGAAEAQWHAHCPACGAFDALSWQRGRPPIAHGGGRDEAPVALGLDEGDR